MRNKHFFRYYVLMADLGLNSNPLPKGRLLNCKRWLIATQKAAF